MSIFSISQYIIPANSIIQATVEFSGGAGAVCVICLEDDDGNRLSIQDGKSDIDKITYKNTFYTNNYTKLLISYRDLEYIKIKPILESFDIDKFLNNQDNEYIPLSNNTDNTHTTKRSLDDLSNITVNFVGDSITHAGKYIVPIVNKLGINAINCGLSSSTIAINNTYLQNKSCVERVCGLNGNDPYPDAEIWIFMAGLNDKLYNSVIGNINSTDNTTVYGALKTICDNIRKRPNNPTLLMCTITQSNRNGDYINQVNDAIKKVSKLYAAPVVDVYSEAGICPANLYNVTSDGVHINDAGVQFIYPLFINAIIKYCKGV